jgi:aspartate carbamoyltransferase catalytic subunit
MTHNKQFANNLFGLRYLTRQQMEQIFSLADKFKEVSKREVKKIPSLRGKTVINLFFENSTRTQTSFSLAAKRLSADVLNFSASKSSLTKGESLVDTIKNLESYSPDIFIIRIANSVCLRQLSRHTNASIINAGEGKNEHPTQALLDIFTALQHKGKLENLNVLIVGDIRHSRVARSNILGFKKFGANLRVCAPATLIPYEFEKTGVEVFHDLDKAMQGADIIIALRIQKERQGSCFFPTLREYKQLFSLTPERLKRAPTDCLVMHPGPVNWDIEISSRLKRRLHPYILNQVENGLAVRMAVLYLVGTYTEQA